MPTKVAIIHDWLITYRGGERVLEALCEQFPDAEIFTLFHREGQLPATIERHKIHTSFLSRLPGVGKYYRYLLPLMPFAIERFDLSGFDLVISSSHCVAKGVIPPPQALHVCYCHTPMRYAWDRYNDYFGKSWLEPLLSLFFHYLRMWDTASASRVDRFVTNSAWTGKRVEKYYRREFTPVHPFVDLQTFKPKESPRGDYFLIVSAFAPYKRIDLAIEACRRLNKPLWIVGGGQDESKLKGAAGSHVTFLGSLGGEDLAEVYANAKALLFPGEEDFGITPLEAMACGTPVIAFDRGGVTESVIDGETGIFFSEQAVESLEEAIGDFERMSHAFTKEKCRKRAEQFSRERFHREWREAVEQPVKAKTLPPAGKSPESFAPPFSN